MHPSEPPRPQQRPRFALWMFDRGLKIRPTARELGCSHEQLRRATLPFDDKDHLPASAKLRQKVDAYTGGAVGLNDWAPFVNSRGLDASDADVTP